MTKEIKKMDLSQLNSIKMRLEKDRKECFSNDRVRWEILLAIGNLVDDEVNSRLKVPGDPVKKLALDYGLKL